VVSSQHGPRGAHQILRALAELWPRAPVVDDELTIACRFLDAPEATRLVAASNVLGIVVGVLGLLLVGLTRRISVLPIVVIIGVVPPIAARQLPIAAAQFVRTRALGESPALFGRLTLILRVEPSLERAARFASRSGDGRLAAALGGHVRRARAGPESGLRSFAKEWGAWEPALERASARIVDATAAPPDERIRGCERALETVRSSVEHRLASFADDLRGPVTGLYAFGVLLPLALVGVLPAARIAGLQVGMAQLVLLYDLLLPLGLLGAGAWLLTKRPVAFPPPRVGRDHPDVPDRRQEAVALGIGTAVAAAVLCRAILPWATPIAALGTGGGVALYHAFEPRTAIRERVRETEDGLPDALALVGRRVADGTAVERALTEVSEELPGPAGELLGAAAERTQTLGIPVEGAFFGEYGVLSDLPSDRARDAGTMFTLAATEGAPAGDVLVTAGDHLRALQQAGADGRRKLAAVTGTLANTAVLFGPLVGGVTVAMVGGVSSDPVAAAGVNAAASSGTVGFETAALGRAVGVYVLAMAGVLTGLSTALEHGVDRSLLGYRVGIALPTATGAYVAAVVVAGTVL